MAFPFPKKSWGRYWEQVKNLNQKDIISLLDKDERWEYVATKGSRYIYRNSGLPRPDDRVEIHYHGRKGYVNKSLLSDLLDHICWTLDDLRKWKVVK